MAEYVEQDKQKAFNLYLESANLGSSLGKMNVGRAYMTGEYSNKIDYKLAVSLMNDAANEGELNAHVFLGFAFFNGLGVQQNYIEAAKHYEIASSENSYAMFSLAQMLIYGKGVIDEHRGMQLLEKATIDGLTDASEMFASYKSALAEAKNLSGLRHQFSVENIDFNDVEKIEEAAYLIVFGDSEEYSIPNVSAWLLFKALFTYLFYEAPPDEQNLFMVSELIDYAFERGSGFETDTDRMFSVLAEKWEFIQRLQITKNTRN